MNSSLSLEQASLSFSLAQGPNAWSLLVLMNYFEVDLLVSLPIGQVNMKKGKSGKGENLFGPDDWMVMLGIR